MRLDPARFDRHLLAELLEAKIIVFYKWLDGEYQGEYLGLSPWARREILQLPPPRGFGATFVDYSQQELTKTRENTARKGLEPSPKGHPIPGARAPRTSIEEVRTNE